MRALAVPAADAHPLDARLALRYVTAGLAVVAALWHLTGAVSLPASATGPLLAAVGVGLGQLAWAGWLLRRPSRGCLATGAVAGVLLLGATGVLAAAAGRPAGTAGAVMGLGLQVVLLVLVLVGLPRRPRPRLVRIAARGGAVTAALAISVVVAGGPHDHVAAADPAAPGSARAAFVCFLL